MSALSRATSGNSSFRTPDDGIAETACDSVAFAFIDVAKIIFLEPAPHIVRLVQQFCCSLHPVARCGNTLRILLIKRQPLNFRGRRLPHCTVTKNRLDFRRRIEPELFTMHPAERLMNHVVDGIVDLIPRLLENRIQDYKAPSRLQYTVRFAYNRFRRSAKVVESERHEGAVKDLG